MTPASLLSKRRRCAARLSGVLALAAVASCCAGTSVANALPASFASEGPAAGQVNDPRGIAIEQAGGDVYVADTENGRIDKFGPEGEFLLAWGFGVADGHSEALQSCTATCFAGLPGAGPGQFSKVEGIAVDNSLSLSRGDIYVADIGNARIEKFSPQGELLAMFGGEFSGLTKHAVAVDSAGTVYVGDNNRVQRFSETGVVQSEVAFPGAGGSENLAVDSAKDVYLQSANLPGVRKYDVSGATGVELGEPRDEAGYGPGTALATGPSDEVFLNDFRLPSGPHHIFAFDPEGKQSASFDAGGEALNGGRGIAYSIPTKALYILSGSAVRIVTPPPPGPVILEGSEATPAVQPTTAMLEGVVNPEGPKATHYHFEYGTSTAYGESTSEMLLEGGAEGEFKDQPASAPITGLSPGTTYHFRVVATNGTQTSFGPDQTFTTLPPVSIDSTSVAEVNDTSARLQAELNPHGVSSTYHFEYDTSPYAEGEAPHGTNVPIPDGDVGAASIDTSVANLIQGLTPSTTYYYRVIAQNALGKSEGTDRAFRTQGLSSTLPDGRSWELVSPPNKHGAPLEPITEEGGLIQSAPGGGAFTYVAIGPLGGESKGTRSPEDSQLLSRRDPTTGWSSEDITTPHEEITLISPGNPSEYQLFAEDLSAGVVEPKGATLLDPENPANTERTPYRREADGRFVALVNAENVPRGTKFGGEESPPASGQWGNGVDFLTATADLSHMILSSAQVLSAGFEPGFEAGTASLYELSGGALALVSVLPDGRPAAEEGQSAVVGDGELNTRGAISNDGSRVFFGAGGQLLMRDTILGKTLQLDQAQPGASGESGGGRFQAASADGSRVFFTDSERLTPDATAKANKPDLYMCEIRVDGSEEPTCALSDLSVDHNVGEAANVLGQVSAIDQTGEHVYFAASGALTNTPNAQGEHAVAGGPNMYEYDSATGQTQLVAVLRSSDGSDWGTSGKLLELTARSSPNGRYFAFMSQRSLSGYDNRDAQSREADAEVFLFDSSTDGLRCVSCDPSGARPSNGVFDPSKEVAFPGLLVDHARASHGSWLAGSIPGWTAQSLTRAAPYQSRYLSDSGRTFFNAADALVPQDTNKVEDVYQYEPSGVGSCSTSSDAFSANSGGCVNLISSGGSKEESAFLDASENGDEVFFLTASRLTADDVDGAFDVYDAHVCSDSSPCPPLASTIPACEGDSCQNPSSPPNDQTPSSLTYSGPGNVQPVSQHGPVGKLKAKPTGARLLARALKSCKGKRQRGRRLACERQARKRYGAKKAAKAKAVTRRKHASRGRSGS